MLGKGGVGAGNLQPACDTPPISTHRGTVGAAHGPCRTMLVDGDAQRWRWQDPLPLTTPRTPVWIPGADGDTGTSTTHPPTSQP